MIEILKELNKNQNMFIQRLKENENDYFQTGQMLLLLTILVLKYDLKRKSEIIRKVESYNELSFDNINEYKRIHPDINKTDAIKYIQKYFI